MTHIYSASEATSNVLSFLFYTMVIKQTLYTTKMYNHMFLQPLFGFTNKNIWLYNKPVLFLNMCRNHCLVSKKTMPLHLDHSRSLIEASATLCGAPLGIAKLQPGTSTRQMVDVTAALPGLDLRLRHRPFEPISPLPEKASVWLANWLAMTHKRPCCFVLLFQTSKQVQLVVITVRHSQLQNSCACLSCRWGWKQSTVV